MKFNWGTGIVIAFALFMTFILSYVFKVQSNDKYDHELVVEDYYKKEATVQNNIEREQNANALTNKITIELRLIINNKKIIERYRKDLDVLQKRLRCFTKKT